MIIYINDLTMKFLLEKARETGRSVDDLASTAVEEYSLQMMKRENWKGLKLS